MNRSFLSLCSCGFLFTVLFVHPSCLNGVQPIVITVGVSTDVDMATGGLFGGTPATTDLRGALNQVNINPQFQGYVINFSPGLGPIHLGALLPVLNLVQSYPLAINGNASSPVIIDGGNTYRGLLAHQGTVFLSNLQIQNTIARGGNGGAGSGLGGGGGMGAGAALFVNSASVILSNVSMNNSVAIGGNGG
ncbi:MAG TPA: hypothetical protein VGO47_04830, partial [Chlamydiales bacterium]|nr:hypothetical protein [Chlamydiales bacterium]